jgi:hypothetical protein
MKIKVFNKETDYEELRDWWGEWGTPQHHQNVLSENGFIISIDGVNIASAFIYSTDSYICWLEHLTANKKPWLLLSSEQRVEVLDKLGEAIFEKAKEMGFKLAFTLATEQQEKKSRALQEWKTKRMGDVVNKNMTQYYKILT